MKRLTFVLSVTLLFALSACDITDNTYNDSDLSGVAGSEVMMNGETLSSESILEIAAGNEDFSILAAAVVFAGLDGVLDGRRQFTVFAPTNDAFEALLEALELTAEELLVEENRELVTSILLYHVAAGARFSDDVTTSEQIRTQQGSFIKVKEDDGFFVGNEENGFAGISAVDIPARNGVIHVIDAVMLPPSKFNPGQREYESKPYESIVDIAAGNEDFSILVEAVQFAGLVSVLDGRRQFTVFAPTNDAFVALLEVLDLSAEELFVDENRGLVRDILLYHVAPGSRKAEDVVTSDRIRTLNKSFFFVQEEDGDFFVGNDENGFAQIIATDIFARNGVIHVIDAVMLP
ncbi:MAG: fasciclin domain-containing protein [Balneolaceae bacterium]|nr:MAG: fasciclin domain-containing protein [Balneolaceae bacterium]